METTEPKNEAWEELGGELVLAILEGGGHTEKNIGKELNAILKVFRTQIEHARREGREEAYLRGKLEAYKNVVAWTEQWGDRGQEFALDAHRAAVSQTEDDLDSLKEE